MNRPRNLTLSLVVGLTVIANNLAWVHLTRDAQPQLAHDPAVVAQPAHPISNLSSVDLDSRRRPPTGTAQSQACGPDSLKNAAGSSSAMSPDGTSTQDIDIPVALSEAAVLESRMDLQNFFQGDTARKLQILDTLTPQGEALGLLQRILQVETDDRIRVAALNRLQQDHSYVGTMLLINALEDPVADVAVAAVQALAATGDRTLLPLLKEKLASLPNGPLRDQYGRSIRRLEYSVTMAMDGASAP